MRAFILVGCFCLGFGALPVSAQESRTFEYTVQRGDTCARIAGRFFGDRRRYDIIHAHNPDMGPTPHVLEPGSILILPQPEAVPDAEVTAVRRRVQAREPSETNWQPANRGFDLYRGWRVNTLEASAAELTFRDRSVVQMRENTLVIVYGGSQGQARRATTTRAELERGTLRSHLGRLRLQVDTPTGDARLQGGQAVVSVDPEGTSRVSNHDGGSARLRSESGGTVAVRPGFGSQVQRGQRPSRPRPLPPAPTWNEGQARFGGLASEGGTIVGEWAPVENARIYRVEVRQAGERALMTAAEVPANVQRFEIHRLPAGEYDVRLATIDQDFFESRPGTPRELEVVLARLVVPGAEETTPELPDPSAEVTTPRALIGTSIQAPEGWTCAAGDDANGALRTAGRQRVVCTDADGQAVAPFEVDVLPIEVATEDGEAPAFDVVAGLPTEINLHVASEAPVPDTVTLASDDLTIGDVDRDGNDWTAEVTAPGPGRHALRLMLGDTAVGEAVVMAGEPEPEPEPEPVPIPQEEDALPPIGQESLGVWQHPSLLGLRDPRPGYHAATVGIGSGGNTPFGDGSYSRLSLGLEADIAGTGRIVASTFPSFGGEGAGDGDLYAGIGAHVASETVSIYAEFAGWFPTGQNSQVLLAPSVTVGYEPSPYFFIRTRQGALVAVDEGPRTWASAYGLDLRLVGPLFAGIEADLAIGRDRGETVTHFGGGLALGVTSELARVSAALHRSFTDDLRDARGDWIFTLNVRFMVPGQSAPEPESAD